MGVTTKMLINPSFQQPAYISVLDSNNTELMRKENVSRKDINKFMSEHGNSVPGFSVLEALVLPVRTNNLSDFAKDLFLPTFVNHAIKVENVALRVFLSIGGIILDLATLAVRVMTSPIRAIYNSKCHLEHPLVTLVKSNSKAQKGIAEGKLTIKAFFEKIKITAGAPEQSPNGQTIMTTVAERIETTAMFLVATKALPGISNHSSYTEKTTRSRGYHGVGTSWALIGQPTEYTSAYNDASF